MTGLWAWAWMYVVVMHMNWGVWVWRHMGMGAHGYIGVWVYGFGLIQEIECYAQVQRARIVQCMSLWVNMLERVVGIIASGPLFWINLNEAQ